MTLQLLETSENKIKLKKACLNCNREILIYSPCFTTRKFCNRKCRQAWDSHHLIGANNPNWKGGSTKHICSWCGRVFEALRWKKRKYCSRTCYAKAQGFQKRKYYTCKNCGEQFHSKRKIGRSKYFCSKKCEGLHNRGEKNPFYRGVFSSDSLKKIMKARHTRPNNVELNLLEIIQRQNLPFEYVGNGKVIIGGKNPDFVHTKGEKKVIELFGNYWHSPLYCRKVRATMTFDAIMKHYVKCGYDCLIIWEGELTNENRVMEKMKKFVGGIKC